MTCPCASGRHCGVPLRTAATSECVVPRSMPMPSLRGRCAVQEISSGSEIWRRAMNQMDGCRIVPVHVAPYVRVLMGGLGVRFKRSGAVNSLYCRKPACIRRKNGCKSPHKTKGYQSCGGRFAANSARNSKETAGRFLCALQAGREARHPSGNKKPAMSQAGFLMEQMEKRAYQRPASARSTAALSVCSQLNSGSLRPKWP